MTVPVIPLVMNQIHRILKPEMMLQSIQLIQRRVLCLVHQVE